MILINGTVRETEQANLTKLITKFTDLKFNNQNLKIQDLRVVSEIELEFKNDYFAVLRLTRR